MGGTNRLGGLGVDQHEGDAAWSLAAVAPGVIGASLNQDIAQFEQRFAYIHHRVDLAVEYDRVVDGVGLVEPGMPSPRIMGDAGGSQRSPYALRVGREFHHAKLRTVLFRWYPHGLPDRAVAVVGVVGGGLPRLPELDDGRRSGSAVMHGRRRAVEDEDGSSISVMAGDNASNWARGHLVSPGVVLGVRSRSLQCEGRGN